MKCNRCGYINDDSAKFCTSCGAPLTMPAQETDEEVLIELAEAYTGNLAAAKKITADNPHTVRCISEACLQWIRQKETDLFQDAGKKADDIPTLDSISSMEDTLRDLDYEERIVVLMHCVEKMSPSLIAQILHISEEDVIYYLQSAYTKNHPVQVQKETKTSVETKKTIRRKRPVRKKETKEHTDDSSDPKFLKKLTWQSRALIAVIAAIIIGTFLGVKNYAHQEYLRGLEYLNSQDYEAAKEPLLNAKRYGGNEDAGLKLGDVYYGQEDYSAALHEYESCRQNQAGVKEALIRTYEKLADASVEKSNYGDAAGYLEKQYALDENDHTYVRLLACQNNGSYESDEGNVFNAWGNPIKLVSSSNGKTLFQVELEYNDDRTLKEMNESLTNSSSKVRYNQFGKAQEIEASWYLQEKNYVSYSVQAVQYDDHNNPTLFTITTPTSIKKTTYVYSYDGDQILSSTQKTGTTTVTSKYQYDGSTLKEIDNSDGTVVTFTYDKQGQMIHKTTVKENGDILLDISYTYNDQGNLEEVIQKDTATNSLVPSAANQDIQYSYTSTGEKDMLVIRGENDEIANGYYIQGTGWIILYHTNGNA